MSHRGTEADFQAGAEVESFLDRGERNPVDLRLFCEGAEVDDVACQPVQGPEHDDVDLRQQGTEALDTWPVQPQALGRAGDVEIGYDLDDLPALGLGVCATRLFLLSGAD